jgi:Cytochrome P450
MSDKDINDVRLRSLVYLNSCITEALRIFPPVPISSPRVVPWPGETIDGFWVPYGVGQGHFISPFYQTNHS